MEPTMHSNRHLTQGHSDQFSFQLRATRPGQASWANGGPFATTCGECGSYGYYKQIRDGTGSTVATEFRQKGCKKFYELTGRHGPAVPPNTSSCRYFERKEKQ